MTGGTFLPVAGGDVNIQDIKPSGDNIDTGDVYIETLNAYGQMLSLYSYYGADEWDDGSVAGWYDDDGLVDVTFAAGTGLWVGAPDAETTLTFAGKVPTADVVVQLRAGFTATANMMPTDMNIQDILPAGENINTGDVYIETLNAYGQMVSLYTYYGEDEWDDGSVAGWYDDDGLVDVTFAAGTGLWIGAPDAETTITFPAPEL